MIKIPRTAEPTALAPVRQTKVQAAVAAHAAGTVKDLDGYGVVKQQLFEMQSFKCCYCEKTEEQAKYRHVEHYRPKFAYWWLTWTWENLLFSCVDCNSDCKKMQFPLVAGCVALAPLQAPPGTEDPLVIDPATVAAPDPMDHIEFQRDRIQGKERWIPRGKTEWGRETIRVCGLDRPGLLTLYADHVQLVVQDKVAPLHAAESARDARAVVGAWDRSVRALVRNPRAAFRALSHDALKVLVRKSTRVAYNLQLTHP